MPPGSTKKNGKKRGQSKKRGNSKSESKEDDIKLKVKNKEKECTEKENKLSNAMSLISKSITQKEEVLEKKNTAMIYFEDHLENNIEECQQEQKKVTFTEYQNLLKQQSQQQKQAEIEENGILFKIEQIKVKLREQQFYLMGDKEQQAITGQLSNLLKQIPSKFNSMSTDKLIKEREKQKMLLLSVQQLSEQFLVSISVANKKLNPKDAHLQNYQTWIGSIVSKKNKKEALLQENDLGNQIVGQNVGDIKKKSQSMSKISPYSINDLLSVEQKECLHEMEEKFQQLDKTKSMTGSKLKTIAKHINSLMSQIKQLKQDNTTQTARNQILGSTAGNIQTLRDSYDSEIKYLKSKQLQEQTKNRVLAQKLAEAEQQEDKLVERGDKNTSTLESLEQNMAKFGDNQKIFSNYYRIRELKERMQRIVIDLKNQQRFAEKQAEKKVKTLRHAQKSISEIQQQIDDKTNEIAAFNQLIKEISIEPFSYQQIIKEKSLKTYSVPPFFQFDYHLPQHLCTLMDIFDLQNYLDTQAVLNETYPIVYAPRCPEYAHPLMKEEQMDERKIKSMILHKQSLSQTKLPQQNQYLLKLTSRAELQGIDSQIEVKMQKSSLDILAKQKNNNNQNKSQVVPSQDELERSFSQDILSFSHSPSLKELAIIDNTMTKQQQDQTQEQQKEIEGLNSQQAQIKAERNFIQKIISTSSATICLGQLNLDSKCSSSLLNEGQEILDSQRTQSLQKDIIDGKDDLFFDGRSVLRKSVQNSDQLKEVLQKQKSTLCVSPEQLRDPFSRHLLSRNSNHIKLTKKKENALAATSTLTYLHIQKSEQQEVDKDIQAQPINQESQEDLQDTGRSCSNSICKISEFQIARKQFSQDNLLERSTNEINQLKNSDTTENQFDKKSLPKTNIQRPFSSLELQQKHNQQILDQMEVPMDKWSPMMPSRSIQKQSSGANRIVNSALAERQMNNTQQLPNFKGNFLDDFRKDIQKQKEQQQSNSQEKSSSTETEMDNYLNSDNAMEGRNQFILANKEGGTNKRTQFDLVRSSTSKLSQNEVLLRSKQPQTNSISQGQQQSQQQINSSLAQNLQLPFSREVWEVNSQKVIVKKQTQDIFSKISQIASTHGPTTQITQKSDNRKVLNTSPLKIRSSQLGQRSDIPQTEETGQESPQKLFDLAIKPSWKIQENTDNTQTTSQKRWTPGIILKRSSNSVIHTPHRQNGNTNTNAIRESAISQSQLKLPVNNQKPFQQQQQQQQHFPNQDVMKQQLDKSKGVVFFLKRSKSIVSKDDKGNITKNGSCNNSQQIIQVKQQSLQQQQQQSGQVKLQVVANEEKQNSYFRPKGNSQRLVCESKSKDLQLKSRKQ